MKQRLPFEIKKPVCVRHQSGAPGVSAGGKKWGCGQRLEADRVDSLDLAEFFDIGDVIVGLQIHFSGSAQHGSYVPLAVFVCALLHGAIAIQVKPT
ncbi:MAG TPA: hypothetical protein VN306_15610, partial [Mycobacterium sp.]|nr:hypothetical protein [Mycobacterium sp.]